MTVRGGTMKTGQEEIFTLDKLAAYLKVGKRTLLLASRAQGDFGFQAGRDMAVSSKRNRSLD